MKNFQLIIFALCTILCGANSYAQIGYQVSLLNTATGEPRANVTVNATIIITNSEDELVYSSTQPSTSNDFGVLTFTIGNEDTFKDADWNKLPFFIEVQVDGNTIGKSQILTVPVAEYAKKTGQLTKEILVGTWEYEDLQEFEVYHYSSPHKLYTKHHSLISFCENGNFNCDSFSITWIEGCPDTSCIYWTGERDYSYSGKYYIDGNQVIIVSNNYRNDLNDTNYTIISTTEKTVSYCYFMQKDSTLCADSPANNTDVLYTKK